MGKFEDLKDLVESAEREAVAFYEKGNKAAGTRFRLALQQVKVLATAIRQEISEKKKGK